MQVLDIRALAISIGFILLMAGTVYLFARFYNRRLKKEYAEMKEKLTPQEFDVWMDLKQIQWKTERLEKRLVPGSSRDTYYSICDIKSELNELSAKELELWRQLPKWYREGNS